MCRTLEVEQGGGLDPQGGQTKKTAAGLHRSGAHGGSALGGFFWRSVGGAPGSGKKS